MSSVERSWLVISLFIFFHVYHEFNVHLIRSKLIIHRRIFHLQYFLFHSNLSNLKSFSLFLFIIALFRFHFLFHFTLEKELFSTNYPHFVWIYSFLSFFIPSSFQLTTAKNTKRKKKQKTIVWKWPRDVK